MYRIFCESYQNYIKSFSDDNYRLQISEPLELIVNIDKFNKEKKECSDKYNGTDGNVVSKKMLDYCGFKYRKYEEKNVEVKLEL